MNLKQLEAFVKVAETKNFSEAARQLYLTQPTVSAHVAALEKELDVCLLRRNTKTVELTDAGRELYGYAEEMLSVERKIREHFGLREKEKRTLRIAASTIPSQYLLPRIMVRYQERYPGETLQVMETDSAGVVEQIIARRAELGFTGTQLEQKQCVYLPFYQDELVVIAPGDERFRSRQGQEITEWIAEEAVILREVGSGTRREAERLLRQMGVDMDRLNIAASMENQETIKRSVKSGMGIAILSRLAAEEEINAGELLAFPLGKEGGTRSINLVYDRTRPVTPEAEKFIRIVKELFHL